MNTATNTNNKNLQVGFFGLGDQGASMAIAIAEPAGRVNAGQFVVAWAGPS
jgi:hypothetical protein